MFTISLEITKTTKNKVVYANEDFGALYVPNPIVEQLGRPDRIELELRAVTQPELKAA